MSRPLRRHHLRRYLFGFIAVVILMPLIPLSVGLVRAFDAMPAKELQVIADRAELGLQELRDLYPGTDAEQATAVEKVGTELQRIRATATRFSVFERQTAVSLLTAGLTGALLAILLGIGLWYVTLRQFLLPLRELANGIAGVKAGDYPAPLRAGGHPELRFVLENFNGMVATIADQAERIRAAEREGVSRFLVHQFRNSLTPISLGSQNLRQVTAGALQGTQRQVAEQALHMIDAQTERMKRLIDEFASLTRFPAPSTRTVELVALVRSVLETVPVSSQDADVRLEAPEELRLVADPTMIEHAVLNLVENAVDALSDGIGAVEVQIRGGSGAALSVCDTGKGMDPEMVERILDEHFTSKSRGMGLGLAFVKRVCDAHDFTLSIDSTPNLGTTVQIDLSSGVQE
ncbi:MAG: hypothetical protein GVY29_07485 [Spirochaetes bacterium]|jgi:two-component system nitrogen regulation sensor histidine kinase NtrY|nr:hypothetical protein [Spirochaetota bacterium]